MFLRIIIKIILILLIFQNFAYSDEYFLMLKNKKVNVMYGPSIEDNIKLIYKKKNLPLKVTDKKENFRKIIDHNNNSGWIHISQMRESKTVIMMENKILFKKPSKFSKPIVILQNGKLVKLEKCKFKWCKVKTKNYTGWIVKKSIWGL